MNFSEIPKVELHCHLEACFRPATVMGIGKYLGLDIPQDAQRFHDDWLLSRPLQDLETALKRFADIQKLWCSEEIIERLTFEACEDAVAQGIRIMEFRYSPDFIRHGSEHLDFQQIHDAILRGLSRAPENEIAIGLIGIVQKTLPLKEAEKTVDFIAENALTFVAIDLADQDTRPLTAYARLLDKARKANLQLTVHAGEVPGPDAPGHVISAIEDLGAQRIGHGIHIVNDSAAMDVVRQRNVALEVCVTSNYLTSSVSSTAEHPIRRLMESGIPLTINSDDPGLFGIDLCHEYEILHREHGFSIDDFDRCNDIAAAQSFLPLEQKRRVWPRHIDVAS
jgi:adenosine deaminase